MIGARGERVLVFLERSGLMRLRMMLAAVLCATFIQAAGAASIFDRVTNRQVTLPAGTRLPVVLDTYVASNVSRPEQPITAHVSRDVIVDRVVVVPAGSQVFGVVTDARRAGRVKGRAHVGIRFTSLIPRGTRDRYRIQTASFGRTAPATKKQDAANIGA